MIGKIERVPLRDIWKHEAYDFTKWFQDNIDVLTRDGIEVVDMECSAFFAASSAVGLKALTVFYVSDIISKRPFYVDLKQPEKSALSCSIKMATDAIQQFIRNSL